MKNTTKTRLKKMVTALLKEKSKHEKALAEIVATLTEIGIATPKTQTKRSTPNPRKRFKVSGKQFVLDLIKDKKAAATSVIIESWKNAGRGSGAYTTLSTLVKEKRIMKSKKNGKGSLYTLAESKQ